MNCEVCTVVLENYSIHFYSTLSTNTCINPKPVAQVQARTDTNTHTHTCNLYKGSSLINIQRWQLWLTFDLPSLTDNLNLPYTSSKTMTNYKEGQVNGEDSCMTALKYSVLYCKCSGPIACKVCSKGNFVARE